MTRANILRMLNHALELEHAARIQYLSHAETIKGPEAEPIVARLKEIANDERTHEEKFRKLIGMMGGVPTMGIENTFAAKGVPKILSVNLKGEKDAVDTYLGILNVIVKEKDDLRYEYLTLEHEIRHIIMDEQDHISEIMVLSGK